VKNLNGRCQASNRLWYTGIPSLLASNPGFAFATYPNRDSTP
jgi:hypothetical protein